MSMISSFTKWSRERIVFAQWNTLALVVLCFVGFLMPTSGKGQVWVDDLIGKSAPSVQSFSKSGEAAVARPSRNFGQNASQKALSHGIEVEIEDLVLRSVEVRNVEGRLLYRNRGISEAEMKYELSQMSPGLYVITTEASNGIRQTKVSVIE